MYRNKKLILSAILLIGAVNFLAYAQGRLQFTPDKKWIVDPPTSSMRVAQYRLPLIEGDAEDTSLILYFFGGGGGSIQANLDRWVSQMAQPDGSDSQKQAKIKNSTINGLKVTLLDLAGTYQAETAPGAGTRYNKPNYRMIAGVIETPNGPYFIKLVGPARTVEHWQTSFNTFLNSFQF
jgi:hypothetical protein